MMIRSESVREVLSDVMFWEFRRDIQRNRMELRWDFPSTAGRSGHSRHQSRVDLQVDLRHRTRILELASSCISNLSTMKEGNANNCGH
jgi:hypothetical protein